MSEKKILFFSFLSILFLCSMQNGFSQTIVRGAVTDAKTGETIPFVNVLFEGTNTGKTTDFNGQYFIQTNDTVSRIRFSILGYKTEFRNVKPGESQIISMKLTPEVMQLKELPRRHRIG